MTVAISDTSHFSTAPIIAHVTRQWQARFGYEEPPSWGVMVDQVYGEDRARHVAGVKEMPEKMSWGGIDNFCVRILGMHPASIYPDWFDVSARDGEKSKSQRRTENRLEREERATRLAAQRRQSASAQAAANLTAHHDVV